MLLVKNVLAVKGCIENENCSGFQSKSKTNRLCFWTSHFYTVVITAQKVKLVLTIDQMYMVFRVFCVSACACYRFHLPKISCAFFYAFVSNEY